MEIVKRQIIRVDLSIGVTVEVTPVTQAYLTHLYYQSLKFHPNPDPEGFMKPIPNALDKKSRFLDSGDPVYQALVGTANRLQMNWVNNQLFFERTNLSDEVRAWAVETYKDDIDKLRDSVVTESNQIEDWQIALHYFMLVNADDQALVLRAIKWTLPLTEEEVVDGVAYFRPKNQRSPVMELAENTSGIFHPNRRRK